MNPVIHGCVGWLVAQPLPRRRDRALVTLAAVAPDLDGVGLLVSEDLYLAWHHRLAHGALWAVATAVAVGVATRSPRAALVAVVAFHTHIVMDLVGSGPGWPILYGYPWTDTEWLPSWQWNLASWQNFVFALFTLGACVGLGVTRGRTPVELCSARVDAQVVEALRARLLRRRPGA
jgi:inner membrane protein